MSLHPARLGDAPGRRESQVAIAILFGRTCAETAIDLGISPRTVGTYKERLFLKYGVRSCAQLAVILMGSAIKPAAPEAAE